VLIVAADAGGEERGALWKVCRTFTTQHMTAPHKWSMFCCSHPHCLPRNSLIVTSLHQRLRKLNLDIFYEVQFWGIFLFFTRYVYADRLPKVLARVP
jgi:isopentenyldiphosphate isomerase